MGSHPTRAMTKPSAKAIHEGEKRNPRRGTKDDEWPRSEMDLLQRHAPQLCGPASAPHRISLRLPARLLRLPLKGGNRRACVDVLVGKVAGIGWPPHRISLRLPARLLRLPLKGGVILERLMHASRSLPP